MTNEKIADSKEIKFMIDEAGFECIESIKAQLERLGWYNQYDEQGLQRISLGKFGNMAVEDIYLDDDNAVLLYCDHARNKEALQSMLINGKISVDVLHEILIGLEKIEA